MTILQKDIAEELNLSVSTVSRALLADPRIPQETRAKVLSFAARSGYRLKRKDRGFLVHHPGRPGGTGKKLSRSLMIAAFVQSDDLTEGENAARFVAGLGRAAQEFDISLVLHAVPFTNRAGIHRPECQPEVVRSGKVQGVILLNMFDPSSVAGLARQTTCVTIDILYPGLRMDCVGEENIESIGKAVRHLVSLGHRKLGYVDEVYDNNITHERRSGFITAAAEADLPFDLRYILRARQRSAAAEETGLGILHQWIQDGITGIVCVGDQTSINICRWLRDHGYRCPEQVSVTGFDAMTVPPDVPPLTTLRVYHQDLGRLAVERLISRLQEPTLPPIRVMVDCDLVVGKSTGPAPGCK
jgi:LacI family transcriptional regulator